MYVLVLREKYEWGQQPKSTRKVNEVNKTSNENFRVHTDNMRRQSNCIRRMGIDGS